MMLLRRFEIHQPSNVAEAVQMRAHFGEQASLYAGGTELLLAMKHDVLRYEHLIDVKVIPGLDAIELRDGMIWVGATATHRSIEQSALLRSRLPVFTNMESLVANVRVRNTGTLGGNLCFAEPHSDPATLLLVLGARAHVQGKAGIKTMGLNKLITGAYETSLAADELLVGIEIPLPAKSHRAAYLKFQLHERPTLGLALVLAVEADNITEARAVVGSVSAIPTQSHEANSLLVGSKAKVEKQLPDAAKALAEAADPVDDLEGSAEYKRHLIGVFLKRGFAQALS